MSVNRVFDTWALLAYLNKEKTHEIVEEELINIINSNGSAFLSAINWGELRYILLRRKGGQNLFDKVNQVLINLDFQILGANLYRCTIASTYKAQGKISYADCFAAALAKEFNCPLITGDKEFLNLKDRPEIIFLS